MGNLNDLFQQQVNANPVDDPEVLPEEINLVTEDITFDDEEASVEEMVTSLEALKDLYTELEAQGGLSRSLVLECLELMPNFDGNRGINHYSSVPTGLRYNVAMEEISKGMWAAIAAGVAVVIAIISKLVKWMWPSKSGGGGGGTPTESDIKASANETIAVVEQTGPEVVNAIKEVDEAVEALALEALKQKVLDQDKEIRNLRDVKALDDIVFELIKTGKGLSGEGPEDIPSFFHTPASPIMMDVLTFGPWSSSVYGIIEELKSSSSSKFLFHVKNIVNTFKTGLTKSMTVPDADALKAVLEEKILFNFNGKNLTAREITEIIKAHRQALEEDKSTPKDWSISKALESAKKLNDRGNIVNSINTKAALSIEILNIEAELNKFMETTQPDVEGKSDSTTATFGQRLVTDVKSQIRDIGDLLNEINRYTDYASNAVCLLADISTYAAKSYAHVISTADENKTLGDVGKELLVKVKDLITFNHKYKDGVKRRKQG